MKTKNKTNVSNSHDMNYHTINPGPAQDTRADAPCPLSMRKSSWALISTPIICGSSMIDGATPQPAQRLLPEQLEGFIKKQFTQAKKVYAVYGIFRKRVSPTHSHISSSDRLERFFLKNALADVYTLTPAALRDFRVQSFTFFWVATR